MAGLGGALVAGFYDIEQVNEIRLYFSEPNWDEILDSLYAAGQGGRLIGTAVINGVRFESVGVRYKGASSYNPSRRKNPFNIRLDERIPGQNIEGHGTLRLANVYKDPSFVREALSYEIARRYMPAGRASFANIYVNDTLIGLYTNNEDPDKLFMRRFFFCDENPRFKGRMTDSARMIGWKYLGPDSPPYRHYFELESDSGWTELIGFLDTLNNHNSALPNVLNVDRHLWMLAFDILMVNLDAPINMPQNHYLYRDASARFNPIVWDLNENFGAFRDLAGTGQLTVAQMQQLDPFLRSEDPEYPIVSRVLNDPRRRRAFVAHMKTMIGDIFSSNWYRDRAYEIQDIIDEHVRADPNKFYTYNDFVNNVTRSVGQGPLAIVGLTELMGPRISFLLNRPEFRATAPRIAEARVAPACPAPSVLVSFLAQVEDADSVFLGLRQNPAMR
ncbi:MAG: CotH kinase family protein, partial [candidate division WOR-3 bacterium]